MFREPILKRTHQKPWREAQAAREKRARVILREAEQDTFIIGSIEKLVSRYKSVLIVYGSAHLVMQRKALEAAFGKPVLLTDNPEQLK
jgi:hypothetical protein